jgi:hypothetical protein
MTHQYVSSSWLAPCLEIQIHAVNHIAKAD